MSRVTSLSDFLREKASEYSELTQKNQQVIQEWCSAAEVPAYSNAGMAHSVRPGRDCPDGAQSGKNYRTNSRPVRDSAARSLRLW